MVQNGLLNEGLNICNFCFKMTKLTPYMANVYLTKKYFSYS